MLTLYKLHFYAGRQGTYEGLFLEDSDKLKKLVDSGDNVYFGEVLGKHSEISGPLEESDYTVITSDEKVVGMAKEFHITTIDSPVTTYVEYYEDQGMKHVFQ